MLTHELLKNCTSIIELSDVNELCSEMVGKSCKVYGLRADFGYPEHLIPSNTRKFIAYLAISNRKLDTSYGQAQFIDFCYEPTLPGLKTPIGVLNYFLDIYAEDEKSILKECKYKEGEEFVVELFPSKITKKNLDFWKSYLDEEYDVNDKISYEDFMDDYEITNRVNWETLYDNLPDNIDDLDNESEYETEPESELEEGEIKT
jgi:hypothetical protein